MMTFKEFLNADLVHPEDSPLHLAKGAANPGLLVHNDLTKISKEKPRPVNLQHAAKAISPQSMLPNQLPAAKKRTKFGLNQFKARANDFGSPTKLV